MANISLISRSTRSKKENPDSEIQIWIRVRSGRSLDIKVPTQISVPIKYWSGSNINIRRSISNPKLYDRLSAAKERLDELTSHILAKCDEGYITDSETLRTCVRSYMDRCLTKDIEVPKEALALLKFKIREMEQGANRTNGHKYSPNTIKQWQNFLKILTKFHASVSIVDFENINRSFWDKFKQFMDQEGYLPKATNKYLATFRAFLEYARNNGVKISPTALSSYKKISVPDDETLTKTYLNEDELQALYNMPLTGLKEQVRDTFLLGCYLGQRVSDYSTLTAGDFTTTSKGTPVVKITQKKTNSTVTIPILYENIYKIAQKYNYVFPHVHDVVLNRYIKEILNELSDTVPALKKMERTVLTMKERASEQAGKITYTRDEKGYVIRPRYEIVTSHTARRSCITNLYLRGVYTTSQLMAISGHKSEKTFYEYLCCSSEEVADMIANITPNNRNIDLF